MQKALPLIGLFLIFSCSPTELIEPDKNTIVSIPQDVFDKESADGDTPLEQRSKASILAYFDHLIANEQLLVGQHCGDGPDATSSYYTDYVAALANETGKDVGIVGADLGFFPSNRYPVQTLIDHWGQGGLVTVSWHADNPFVDGYDVYYNTVEHKDKIDLKALLRSADYSQEWVNYRTELDNIAGALQKLKAAGVTVIWRPFHEMNGDFFWWGIDAYNNTQTNEAAYKALWVDLYETLTYDYGLDNLIWTYSVIPQTNWNAGVTNYFPGSDYVDLVGMDYYGQSPDFPDYEALKSLGKTMVMSESGPSEANYGNWDMMTLANTLKGKAAYFLQWHSWNGAKVAIKDNKNTFDMMNSPSVITRDEIKVSKDLL
jgi:mannan endo-1,4-beta-mannosidase